MSADTNCQPIPRRRILTDIGSCLGAAALASLLPERVVAAAGDAHGGLHFPARARHVIFLHQSGAPSQIDLLDPKPEVARRHGEELPDSVRRGQRLTTMTANQTSKPLMASPFRFQRRGESGLEFSELLPFTAGVADQLCVVRSMVTQAINHDPAITFMQTGIEQPGRPSMGAWTSYGLGSETDDLPTFLLMISGGVPGDQPLSARLWGSGFLPSRFQAVQLRGRRDPVLYLHDPPGISRPVRRRMLDALGALNETRRQRTGDLEIEAKMRQFEMAFRMQDAVPRLVDLSDEPERTFRLYGEEARQPGSFASNCLMARRLVERGVRFVQLYHRGWDHHSNLLSRLPGKCRQTDQPSAGLVADLAQRGLLDKTLVVWAGEFGRTVYCQGSIDRQDRGRDHHPGCFSIWLAGGGVKKGFSYGVTDEFSYNVADGAVTIHDLQATLLHCMGIDHERLTFLFQGREHRLTDVAGTVVQPLLS